MKTLGLMLSAYLLTSTVEAQADSGVVIVPCFQLKDGERKVCETTMAGVNISIADLIKESSDGTLCFTIEPEDRASLGCPPLADIRWTLPAMSNDGLTPCFQVIPNDYASKACTPIPRPIDPFQPCGPGHRMLCPCACCAALPFLPPPSSDR